ncbi:MAG: hypothetical protein LUC35_01070, partial [Clostridiales bacterium]|nr:hypothetical protein [Clostridiales bacterium]
LCPSSCLIASSNLRLFCESFLKIDFRDGRAADGGEVRRWAAVSLKNGAFFGRNWRFLLGTDCGLSRQDML